MSSRILLIVVMSMCLVGCGTHPSLRTVLPTVTEAANAKTDVWADAALRQPGGPSYEFFEKLLPPLRYVDAWFRDYPLVLSAPGAAVKGRLVSNGSMINALARQPAWVTETGTPVRIYLGKRRVLFGADPVTLRGPRCEKGYLPIYELQDVVDGSLYTEKIFAATDPALAAHGVIFVQFTLEHGATGKIELQLEHPERLKEDRGVLRDPDGRIVVCAQSGWTFRWALGSLFVELQKGQSISVAIATTPLDSPVIMTADAFDHAHRQAVEAWQKVLDSGMQITVPEPRVNDAWRAMICGSYGLLNGDTICYSAGNQYSHLYEAEGGDAAKSLLLWGHADDVKRMILPLLDFSRKGLEFHQAGLKLQLLSTYYWMTRDGDFIHQQSPRWQKEITRIEAAREKESGLLPREKYAADIDTLVYSLNVNANSWSGLHQFSAVLKDLGKPSEAGQIDHFSAEFRQSIVSAVTKSERTDVKPPFIPMALFGEESPPDKITEARPGSYWTLMSPYVLGSGIFRYDSAQATAIIEYLQQHAGLCMGMIRSRPDPGFWIDTGNIDDLYGIRYDLSLFERDEVDRALVTFYAKLAQGMTRDTFISGEGTCITPLDSRGRQMYMPPNSAGNAHFLYLLRYLLIQDWDIDGDGKPETLRLLFATPRQWLEEGKHITVDHAPTAFGEISFTATSHLKQGNVSLDISLPTIVPAKTLLRLRLPGGYHLKSAAVVGGKILTPSADDSLDLSDLRGHMRLTAQVDR